jgi:hypothetical protein
MNLDSRIIYLDISIKLEHLNSCLSVIDEYDMHPADSHCENQTMNSLCFYLQFLLPPPFSRYYHKDH